MNPKEILLNKLESYEKEFKIKHARITSITLRLWIKEAFEDDKSMGKKRDYKKCVCEDLDVRNKLGLGFNRTKRFFYCKICRGRVI